MKPLLLTTLLIGLAACNQSGNSSKENEQVTTPEVEASKITFAGTWQVSNEAQPGHNTYLQVINQDEIHLYQSNESDDCVKQIEIDDFEVRESGITILFQGLDLALLDNEGKTQFKSTLGLRIAEKRLEALPELCQASHTEMQYVTNLTELKKPHFNSRLTFSEKQFQILGNKLSIHTYDEQLPCYHSHQIELRNSINNTFRLVSENTSIDGSTIKLLKSGNTLIIKDALFEMKMHDSDDFMPSTMNCSETNEYEMGNLLSIPPGFQHIADGMWETKSGALMKISSTINQLSLFTNVESCADSFSLTTEEDLLYQGIPAQFLISHDSMNLYIRTSSEYIMYSYSSAGVSESLCEAQDALKPYAGLWKRADRDGYLHIKSDGNLKVMPYDNVSCYDIFSFFITSIDENIMQKAFYSPSSAKDKTHISQVGFTLNEPNELNIKTDSATINYSRSDTPIANLANCSYWNQHDMSDDVSHKLTDLNGVYALTNSALNNGDSRLWIQIENGELLEFSLNNECYNRSQQTLQKVENDPILFKSSTGQEFMFSYNPYFKKLSFDRYTPGRNGASSGTIYKTKRANLNDLPVCP